ncbi:hypothetical protein A2872_03130 [Candidatus Gottesmanbacteria bacterium RIFCSPHIGHO2_01_FULL_42_12]|uniref:Uncharacterized protein n=1 Tax=Candidatus Gottesmanbacteria bacterium RIFCSPHIGHO2_01_FULL_42_12 TaxID=1798377 RepID=A0A1F5Z0I1_9BACT|nr:MAG: hypothetical protein A2872_03130 [Candidatus Gottesmanbacteria bacterium RIFCSPHIGHO2_01_FULL_42_12]
MGSETDKLLSYIEKTNSNLEWLHFLLLFKLIGVDPRNATLAVPFLHHDTDLGIPGIRKIALNNESGGNSPGFKFILGDVSEQIRLPNKSVDLLVVNHGVVLYEWTKQLDHSNNYPAEVYRVTQPNGVLMAYDYDYWDYIADMFGFTQVPFGISQTVLSTVCSKMGLRDADAFEDLFTTVNGNRVAFFRR